ncbi:MAG: pyrroloquinoline quinone biosynthesis protein PqqE [Acidobacteriaceae bacterium]|nr:pyrroloquinoline quinone biosynthesis protein PqqE [Acidobacteriaceae bacterium]
MSAGPLALIAELTHRCPLHCVYCSNPVELKNAASELSTEQWFRIFEEAGQLGILHVHFTGGEPLARSDLRELTRRARSSGLYVNLITSGIGLSESRLATLAEAGLEHIQLSFQGSRENLADEIAGTSSHARKLQLAREIRNFKLAFTVNVVVHRENLDHLAEILSMVDELAPDRVEVANVQYYGWALRNQERLLPTRQQVDKAQEIVHAAQAHSNGRMRIDYVAPDYYARFPKACMGGWGRRLMLIDPTGQALPCHAAAVIPGLNFDDVRDHPLKWIWNESAAFKKFRGEAWMPEPCRSCDHRTEDFGGCRCQALLLTGDATATDPVCSLAPSREVVDTILARINHDSTIPAAPNMNGWIYRPNPR